MRESAGHTGCIIYTVRAHDTLTDIFRRFDISIRDLMAQNDRCDLFRLREGQKLYIKTMPRCAGYIMGQNETISSVAQKFGVSVCALLKANADIMPQDIHQGICITLPAEAGTPVEFL